MTQGEMTQGEMTQQTRSCRCPPILNPPHVVPHPTGSSSSQGARAALQAYRHTQPQAQRAGGQLHHLILVVGDVPGQAAGQNDANQLKKRKKTPMSQAAKTREKCFQEKT